MKKCVQKSLAACERGQGQLARILPLTAAGRLGYAYEPLRAEVLSNLRRRGARVARVLSVNGFPPAEVAAVLCCTYYFTPTAAWRLVKGV